MFTYSLGTTDAAVTTGLAQPFFRMGRSTHRGGEEEDEEEKEEYEEEDEDEDEEEDEKFGAFR